MSIVQVSQIIAKVLYAAANSGGGDEDRCGFKKVRPAVIDKLTLVKRHVTNGSLPSH